MEISGVFCRPEELIPGGLYVELPGGAPGAELLRRGAAAAVCRCAPEGEEGRYLTTPDPHAALSLLGANWYGRPGERMTLLLIAGGEEAAVTAHLLRVVLEGCGARTGLLTPRRAETGGGQPALPRTPDGLSAQRLLGRMADAGCTHGVVLLDEGALERREYAAMPAAVASPVGTERTARTEDLLRRSDMAVLNLDERCWMEYSNKVTRPFFTYSENRASADLTARNLRLFPGHMEFEAVILGELQRIHLPAAGGFGLYHGLCALACGLCAGLTMPEMARTLRSARGSGGTLELLPVPTAYTVVSDGAGTPRALERLLTSARNFTAARLICVLGCSGEDSSALCAQMGGVAEQLSDEIILTGGAEGRGAAREAQSAMGGWGRPCQWIPDRRRAVCRALEKAGPGDVVVLALGDRGRREGPDGREIVSRYFLRRSRTGGAAVPAGL